MSDEIWILGINMTKFGKHTDRDVVDLASEAVMAALADGGWMVGLADADRDETPPDPKSQ